MKNDPGSFERNLCNRVRSLKNKLWTSTGFEPVTSRALTICTENPETPGRIQ